MKCQEVFRKKMIFLRKLKDFSWEVREVMKDSTAFQGKRQGVADGARRVSLVKGRREGKANKKATPSGVVSFVGLNE